MSDEDAQSVTWGNYNFDADPLLTTDYHLQNGSPCIDAGDPAYAPYTGETDIDGQPRQQGDYVDIGADEYPN